MSRKHLRHTHTHFWLVGQSWPRTRLGQRVLSKSRDQLQLQEEAELVRRKANDDILRKCSKYRAKQRNIRNICRNGPIVEGKVKSELLIMAMSLCNDDTIADKIHNAAVRQVPMSQFNSRENLEALLEVVQPPNAPIEDDEEVTEICHGNDFDDCNITFHGSAPEGSPAEEHGDEAE